MKISDQYEILQNAGFTEATIDRMNAKQREREAEIYLDSLRITQVSEA